MIFRQLSACVLTLFSSFAADSQILSEATISKRLRIDSHDNSNLFVNEDNNQRSLRRSLANDGDSTLYEYNLMLKSVTPLAASYEESIGWSEYVNPENFTWWGFEIQLPDEVSGGSGGWFSDVTAPMKADGLVQPYNDTTPLNLVNYTFESTEAYLTIKMNLNEGLFWDTYKFDKFDDDGNAIDQTKPFSVLCITYQDDTTTSQRSAVDVKMTVSLSQKVISTEQTSDDHDDDNSAATSVAFGSAGLAVMFLSSFTVLFQI